MDNSWSLHMFDSKQYTNYGFCEKKISWTFKYQIDPQSQAICVDKETIFKKVYII